MQYSSKVTEYKCPSCSAPLSFSPSDQSVHCQACGNSFSVEAVKAFAKADAGNGQFDWGNYTSGINFNDTMDDMVVYSCQSCGALIEADRNTVATTCPYCDNNVVITDRVSGGLKPNAMIPFKISREELPGCFQKFYKNKRLLPKDFFSKRQMDRAQGVYVPFWLFSATMEGSLSMKASKIRTYRQGSWEVTENRHYILEREGTMNFLQVPVDASVKMDNDLMDSIEPFDFSELVPFDGAYLTGYVADRFDSSPDQELYRANRRMENSAASALAGTAGGYTGVSISSSNIKLKDPSVKYVFLPVYVLNCHFEGKLYRYAVNGQTGKVVGELPISKGRAVVHFLVTFAIGAAAAAVIGLLAGGAI